MPKLSRIRQVEFYRPYWPMRYLSDAPEHERFAKRSAAVTELFSKHLAAGPPVIAQTWWVRFIFDPEVTTWMPSDVPATVDLGMGEVHEVPFPPSLAAVTDDFARRTATLDLLHRLLLQLAGVLGWDATPFESARRACLRESLQFRLTSAPKSSPDRRHKVYVQYEIDGDGDAWSTLHVTDRDGLSRQLGNRWDSFPESRSFRAVAKSLRWTGNDALQFAPWPSELPLPDGAPPSAVTVDITG